MKFPILAILLSRLLVTTASADTTTLTITAHNVTITDVPAGALNNIRNADGGDNVSSTKKSTLSQW